jgi:catechol 2,3-dioxygenase
MSFETTSSATGPAAAANKLPAATRLGAAELTVTDLDRSVAFYGDVIGLRVGERDPHRATLVAGGEDVLVLHEDAQARPAGRHAGLYHVALLYPSRLELARAGLRVAAARAPIQGASDHLTHEAIYLPDPDGNGLELAADRPREEWPPMSRAYGAGPLPLDTQSLLAVAQDEPVPSRAEDGLTVGHMHLHVGDVAAAKAFYLDALGFDPIADLGSAAFVSAGGYHHHVAFNTWRGEGVGPQPEGTVARRHYEVVLPDAPALAAVADRLTVGGFAHEAGDGRLLVRDPAGNAILVRTEASA